MFRVKICGITNVNDALAAAAAGADAIGLNFYPRSLRYVEPSVARQICQALPAQVLKVGVFVNESPQRLLKLRNELALDLLQLHGDEAPEFVGELAGAAAIKAFRVEQGDLAAPLEFVQRCRALGAPLQGVLVDACRAGEYGGTGNVADWPTAARLRDALGDLPWILAGGLQPQNVAAAIREVRPYGVDTASGVERSPGHKDAQLVTEFVRAAREVL